MFPPDTARENLFLDTFLFTRCVSPSPGPKSLGPKSMDLGPETVDLGPGEVDLGPGAKENPVLLL